MIILLEYQWVQYLSKQDYQDLVNPLIEGQVNSIKN